jgi:hypothetical protein
MLHKDSPSQLAMFTVMIGLFIIKSAIGWMDQVGPAEWLNPMVHSFL